MNERWQASDREEKENWRRLGKSEDVIESIFDSNYNPSSSKNQNEARKSTFAPGFGEKLKKLFTPEKKKRQKETPTEWLDDEQTQIQLENWERKMKMEGLSSQQIEKRLILRAGSWKTLQETLFFLQQTKKTEDHDFGYQEQIGEQIADIGRIKELMKKSVVIPAEEREEELRELCRGLSTENGLRQKVLTLIREVRQNRELDERQNTLVENGPQLEGVKSEERDFFSEAGMTKKVLACENWHDLQKFVRACKKRKIDFPSTTGSPVTAAELERTLTWIKEKVQAGDYVDDQGQSIFLFLPRVYQLRDKVKSLLATEEMR